MSEPIKFEKIGISLSSDMKKHHATPEKDTEFKVAVLGDFSGRENRNATNSVDDLPERKFHAIDRDNYEDIMKKLNVGLQLKAAGEDAPFVRLQFNEMDDLHPDQIYQDAEIFAALRDTRKKLLDPDTFKDTAEQISNIQKEEYSDTIAKEDSLVPDDAQLFENEDSPGLLDQILDESPAPAIAVKKSKTESDWDDFVGHIISPYLVPDIEKEQDEFLKGVDQSITKIMLNIFQNPEFQEIEAIWRSVEFLVKRLETGEKIKIFVFDISKKELGQDLISGDDLSSTGVYQKLLKSSEKTPGQSPWAAIAGIYRFEHTKSDAITLARMAAVGNELGAPFIAAAAGSVPGVISVDDAKLEEELGLKADAEDAKAWNVLRRLEESSYIGLATPGFLLRLPYGKATDPVDYFEFEEMTDEPVHHHYLWGNPAFACVYLLGKTFTKKGWDFNTGIVKDIGGMPLHVYKSDGESVVKPCAEYLVTDKEVEQMMNRGLMPFVSFKDQDAIRLSRLQSIKDPLTALSGRWWK